MKIIFRLSPLLLFLHDNAFACAVCFGGADSDLVKGFTWGILLLLVLPFTLMAGLISWVAIAVKKKKSRD